MQDSFFHSAVHSRQRGNNLDSNWKIQCLNPLLDEHGLLRSCGWLQYAPTQLDLENLPIILHAKDKIFRLFLEHAHRICVHQSTDPTRAFIQQRYHVIGLRKTLASIQFHCFLCRRFETKNIQPIMVPLPSFRFSTAETQFSFANSGVDLFGPFYIEYFKGVIEKHYGLRFICMVTPAVHLETYRGLNTDMFLNAFRRFCSRQCQPQLLYSDNGKTYVSASEELKKNVKALENDKNYKALAVGQHNVEIQSTIRPSFWRCLGAALFQSAKKRSTSF